MTWFLRVSGGESFGELSLFSTESIPPGVLDTKQEMHHALMCVCIYGKEGNDLSLYVITVQEFSRCTRSF
eukprot:scaffold1713_cov45-Cyclotella_meneghiniana.AAC.3